MPCAGPHPLYPEKLSRSDPMPNIPNPQAVIIADDLTGAMDSSVPFAENGCRVLVSKDGNIEAEDLENIEVLSISTDTRHASAKEAAEKVTKITARLSFCNPALAIKKIDSTLRGNIATESLAMTKALGKKQAVVCPSVPSQNRTMIDGILYIDGQPLSETLYARDIRSPAAGKSLEKLFREQFRGWQVISETHLQTKDPASSENPYTVSICDAANDADLSRIVERRRKRLPDHVFIGAAGLTAALARFANKPRRQAPPAEPVIHGSILFVIGSLAQETNAQLQYLLGNSEKTHYIELADSIPITEEQLANIPVGDSTHSVMLKAPKFSSSRQDDSEKIVSALAQSADKIITHRQISGVIATGGDTASALLSCLQVSMILVSGEIKKGVIYGTMQSARKLPYLVTKAGGFGEPELFTDILDFFNR